MGTGSGPLPITYPKHKPGNCHSYRAYFNTKIKDERHPIYQKQNLRVVEEIPQGSFAFLGMFQ
jgi:hypothetical protein